ncbi:MAG: hypothetical protein SXQ77_00510 [Halobacteria archaeon]|nr:hypothetical protein [Halobacteria archaeon]
MSDGEEGGDKNEDGDKQTVDKIDINPGVQAIVMTSPMTDPLDSLPDEAFDNLLVVSTSGHPKEMEKSIVKRGKDPSNVAVIPVSGSTLRYDGSLNMSRRIGPNDLTSIGITFSNLLNEIGGEDDEAWVVFDNINILMMYANERNVYRFMNTAIGKTRQAGARGLYCTVRDAIKDQSYDSFRQLCDEEIDIRR